MAMLKNLATGGLLAKKGTFTRKVSMTLIKEKITLSDFSLGNLKKS